jgi:hypothetical protein
MIVNVPDFFFFVTGVLEVGRTVDDCLLTAELFAFPLG